MSTAKERLDQQSTYSTVAVDERMDHLEAGMGDGGESHRGQIGARTEPDQVLNEGCDVLRSRWYEFRFARPRGVASDPVLLSPKGTDRLWRHPWMTFHQLPVPGHDVFWSDRKRRFHRVAQRGKVAYDAECRLVVDLLVACNFSLEDSARPGPPLLSEMMHLIQIDRGPPLCPQRAGQALSPATSKLGNRKRCIRRRVDLHIPNRTGPERGVLVGSPKRIRPLGDLSFHNSRVYQA